VCILLQSKIWVTDKNSPLKARAPHLWSSPHFARLRAAVWEPREAPALDDLMNWVLLLNLLVVVAQFANGQSGSPLWMQVCDTLFTIIYVGEVAVKLAVKSFGEYWSAPANRFDFFTTWLLSGAAVLKHVPGAAQNLSHYANMLRLLRLLRVVKKLKQYPSFQFMVSTTVRMVQAAGDILSLLGVVLFFFLTFSVNVFGGVLYEGNPKLEGSAYAESNYGVFNFNDSVMAFGTWFMLLLCEYSSELADGLALGAPHGEVSWLVFPAFYLVGVAIIFEVLKAFTIESFLALKEEADEEALVAARLARQGEGGEGSEESEESINTHRSGEEDAMGDMGEALRSAAVEAVRKELRAGGQELHCRRQSKQQFYGRLRMAYLKLGADL